MRELQDSGDLEADLRDLARRQLTAVMQPRLLPLRRLVIGESGRFPELGRVFYERGPGADVDALAAAFERLAARGLLHVDDPALAAEHFNWLIMSRAAEPGDAPRRRRAARRRPSSTATWPAGVRAFLAAYGPR